MGHQRVNGHSEYGGSFRNWEARSSVRSKPRREMLNHCDGTIFFPPELVPVLRHPRIRDRADIRDEILVHSLYQYMYFTAVVEQLAVLPVAARISLGRLDVQVPPQMRRDAFKICTDEAWHAQCSDDFTEQVARVTRIDPCAIAEPQFVRAVGQIRAQIDPALHDLLDIFFAIVT
jgi:hypothetical protein